MVIANPPFGYPVKDSQTTKKAPAKLGAPAQANGLPRTLPHFPGSLVVISTFRQSPGEVF
jgi:hypothetical protein